MLHISVSSLKDFMTCRRLYYYKRIKKYDRNVFNIPFIVGRVVHSGLGYVLERKIDEKTKKPLNPLQRMLEYFKTEKVKANKEFTLSVEQLEDLNEQEHITQSMLAAYMRKYQVMLRDSKLIGSEVEGALQYGDNVTFVIKLDNLLRVRTKKILHELKTSKYITPEYVKMIQTDIQSSAYFYLYNEIFPKSPIEEIMYDVIRKPSIRQKKGGKKSAPESHAAYLQRLTEWYEQKQDMAVFHIERFKSPKITQENVFNTLMSVADDMLRSKDKESYYQDFEKCASYYGEICPYYELCHEGGEIPRNLVLYQIRKSSYKVNKENKELKG